MSVNYFANSFSLMPNSNSVADAIALSKIKPNPGILAKDILTDIASFRETERANNVKDIIGRTIAAGGTLDEANRIVDAMGYSVNDKARADMQNFANTATAEQRKVQEHPYNLKQKQAQIDNYNALTKKTLGDDRRADEMQPYEMDYKVAQTRLGHANAESIESTTLRTNTDWEEKREAQELLNKVYTRIKQDPEYFKFLLEDPEIQAFMQENSYFAGKINELTTGYNGDLSKATPFTKEQFEQANNFKPQQIVDEALKYQDIIRRVQAWRKQNSLGNNFGNGPEALTKAAEYLMPTSIEKDQMQNARTRITQILSEGMAKINNLLGPNANLIGDSAKLNLLLLSMERDKWKYIPRARENYQINDNLLTALTKEKGTDFVDNLIFADQVQKYEDPILNILETQKKYNSGREGITKKTQERRQEGVMSDEDIQKEVLRNELELQKLFSSPQEALKFFQDKRHNLRGLML